MILTNITLKYRYYIILFINFFIIILSYFSSFYLRLEFVFPAEYLTIFFKTLPWLILIKTITFYRFGLFSGLWRYVSFDDLLRILKATIFSTAIFMVATKIIFKFQNFPDSIYILDWILCFLFISGSRFATRLFRERFKPQSVGRKKRLLIIGAGEAGIMVLRECQNNPTMNAEVIGFIDDDPIKRNSYIHGVRVLGSKSDILRIAEEFGVEEVVIAIPSAKGEVIRDFISYCQIPEIKIKIVPSLQKILNGDFEIKPRTVALEDLLGRESVEINNKEIGDYLNQKRILVTGAAGSIGSELCRQISSFGPAQVILNDYNENDLYFLEIELRRNFPDILFSILIGNIKEIGLLKYSFTKFKPQIVFHAAAFKHVPLMEENPSAAVRNNIITTRNLIYASEHYNVESFVFISTDKAVNASSVMGATKRIGEMILQAKSKTGKTKFMAVRFGNVLGSKGSVVPLFKKQIEEGSFVTVTHPEAKRYFMSVKEAVQLVLQAAAIGKGGEIFILDMGEQIKITDLAKNLITLSGLQPGKDISIEYVGLRPGEKLYEELLLNIEKDKLTKHNKIYVTQPDDFDSKKLRREIKILERLANEIDDKKIIDKLKEIVPSYRNYNKR